MIYVIIWYAWVMLFELKAYDLDNFLFLPMNAQLFSTICWKVSFLHWIFFYTFVKNQLDMLKWIFFWVLCFVSLIYGSVFASTTQSLLLYLYNKSWNWVIPPTLFFIKIMLPNQFLFFHINFRVIWYIFIMVDKVVALQYIHTLIPGTCEYLLHGKGNWVCRWNQGC